MVKACCGKVKEKAVTFKLFSPKAKRVSVAGCFNNWDTNKLPAKKDTKGNWSAKEVLKPGKYEYKFFVDGAWVNDPAGVSVSNSFGSQNSVVEVK